jgi:5-formyltetrahydrofolate cyclo-ligase
MIKDRKAELRKIFKEKRSLLTEIEVFEKSEKICLNFIQNLLPKIYKNSNQIFSLYLDSNKEVSTNSLIQFFTKNSIRFSYPRIVAKNLPLEFVESEGEQEFVGNIIYPKIFEPLRGKVILPDFIILPLLAFDANMSRLGMGGGFFDRTISKLKIEKPNLQTIALAYDFQRLETDLPIENTDQKPDFIVTSNSIFSQKPVVA